MSGTDPSYQRRVALTGPQGIVQMPNAAGNSAALAQSFDNLARSFGGIALQEKQAQQDREVAQAAEEARTVSLRDADGNLIWRDPGDVETPQGRARRNALRQRYDDDYTTSITSQLADIRRRNQDDPAAVQQAVAAFRSSSLTAVPEWYRGRADSILSREAARQVQGVAEAVDRRERGLEAASWNAGLRRDQDELLGYADAGQLDTPEGQRARANFIGRLQTGVASLHLTQDMANILQEDAQSSVAGIRLARSAEDVARRDGVQAGRAALDASLRTPEAAALGAQAQNAARAEGNRRLSVIQQEQSYQQGELRGTLSTVMDSVRAGVRVGPERMEMYAKRADTAGLRTEAADFRALARVQGEATTFASLPLPELVRMGSEATTQDPEDRATPMRRRLLASTVQDRVKALESDPVGFARGQPLVRAALARVQSGEGSMADVVRAQDTVLAANGVDPIGHRIVPQAEIAELKEAVQNRPIVGDPEKGVQGAADMVAAMFNRYGPENRHRVWNDLRGGGLPESLRPVALLLTSPDQQNAFRGYLEASRIGPEDLRRGLGDKAKEVDEAVATQLQTLRQTDGGTGQDAALMADAARASSTLALLYANGSTPKEAAARAVREVVDAGMRLEDMSLGRFRVPRGVDYDAPAFRGALERMLGRGGPTPATTTAGGDVADLGSSASASAATAFSQMRFRIPRGAVSADLTPDQAQEAFRRSLSAFGRFRTAPDGGGVWLQDSNGRPVFTEDGQPYGVRFGEERNPEGPAVLRRFQMSGDFRRDLAGSEGGGRDLAAQNAEGYVGRYQFGTGRLAELGLYQPADGENVSANQWRGRISIPGMAPMSLAEFKRNEAAQEKAADLHFAQIDRVMDDEGLIGRSTSAGVTTRNGLRAVAHLGGVEGMRRFVTSGGSRDPADSNGTRLSAYHRRFAGTRG